MTTAFTVTPFGMADLTSSHVRDRSTWYSQAKDYYARWEVSMGAGAVVYIYDTTTGQFALRTSGVPIVTDYVKKTVTRNDYFITPSRTSEIDVLASIRTVELQPEGNLANQMASSRLFTKLGIGKQETWNNGATLVEDQTEVLLYEMNSNVCAFDSGDYYEFNNYVYPEDVNDGLSSGSPAKMCRRNFFQPEQPFNSEMTKTVSVEFRMKNEGRIFDLQLINSLRNEVGGQ